MRKIIICSTSVMILALPHHIHGIGDRIRDQAIILEHSGNFAVNAVFNTVRKDLLSKDDLLQNAGCIILLKMLDRLANRDREAEICFSRLADDAKVVNSVASIIDMRSPGWYNRAKYNENDDDIRINSSFIRYTTGAMRNHVREGKGGAMVIVTICYRCSKSIDNGGNL